MRRIWKWSYWPWILIVLAAAGWICLEFFNAGTCGGNEEAVKAFLEEKDGQQVVLLKTAVEGRIEAVLYERTQFGDRNIAVFQRRLFGLRLEYVGMNLFGENDGLHLAGRWQAGYAGGARCDIEIYGDNRGGEVGAYVMADAPEVCRENLEQDYILDIYILDGINDLPDLLQQFDPTGQPIEP